MGMGHIVKSYDNELENLKKLLIEMMETNLDQLNLLYDLINYKANMLDINSNFSAEICNKVSDIDVKINSFDIKIIEESLKIFSLRNPVAYDLRFVFSASHVSSNLERLGDNAKAIARHMKKAEENRGNVERHMSKEEFGEYLSSMRDLHTSNRFPRRSFSFGRNARRNMKNFEPNLEENNEQDLMQARTILGVIINKYLEILHILVEMLHLTIDAFNYMSVDIYKKVQGMDTKVDALTNEVSHLLLREIHLIPERTADIRLNFLVNRALERMGDHIVAACRYVNFIEENTMIYN
ncbi:MAG: hypothetical protein LBH40_06265 [Alphaproteobacteria bacterium]|jgi:phosphate uptake regulator|nr:hypothetical protein [Alphaproteobacteria bacterium]